MASRRTRINRVARAIAFMRADELHVIARVAADAAGVPDLMGAKEVAIEIGVSPQNLRKVANLPEPVAGVAATRLWDADEIRAFARERRRNPPGRWNSKQKARAQ